MNPAIWVERNGQRWPDGPAIADGETVHCTWSQFAATVASAAAGLRDGHALEPGDRVAILMRNQIGRAHV